MNYAVMRTMFGDLWVGKTKLEPNGVGVFATFDEAIEAAMDLSWGSEENLAELHDAEEDEAETISEGAEKWIVS